MVLELLIYAKSAIKKFVIYSFKNYIIFKAPPTGQPKNYAMEKGGYLG